jgi:hypothetical protein
VAETQQAQEVQQEVHPDPKVALVCAWLAFGELTFTIF